MSLLQTTVENQICVYVPTELPAEKDDGGEAGCFFSDRVFVSISWHVESFIVLNQKKSFDYLQVQLANKLNNRFNI